jgi:hypothetical protein
LFLRIRRLPGAPDEHPRLRGRIAGPIISTRITVDSLNVDRSLSPSMAPHVPGL